jgi:hypothetical protein
MIMQSNVWGQSSQQGRPVKQQTDKSFICPPLISTDFNTILLFSQEIHTYFLGYQKDQIGEEL